MRLGGFLGLVVLTGAATGALAAPALADSAAPRPTASPSYAERVAQPLREIGHVRARTLFCKAFLAGAGPAVDSALAYETVLLDTVRDFRIARLDADLPKYKSMQRLEADLARLRDLVAQGRGELAQLDALAQASSDDKRDALTAFRDALDGAKGRQMTLTRKLANIYGTLAEMPVSSLVNLPSDGDIDIARLDPNASPSSAFGHTPQAPGGTDIQGIPSADVFNTGSDFAALQVQKNLFNALPGDEMVGRDLARAGDAGRQVLALGGC